MKNKTLLLFICITVKFFSQEINDEGWTALDGKNAEKVIYISSTEGNDATGVIYTPSNLILGDNPVEPIGAVKPFKTIEAVKDVTVSGEATWILFKRGDIFTESLFRTSGATKDKPTVFASYGTQKEMPIFILEDKSALRNYTKTLKHLYVIGLSFYAKTRNPKDPSFKGFKEGGATGVSLLCIDGSCELNDVLIEGCVFRFFKGNSIQGRQASIAKNIRLRRNWIFDNYSHKGHSQGMFGSNLDNCLLEENVFDHNGWYKQTNDYNNPSEGQATIFNHNTYFQDTRNVIFRDNAFYRPSSIGTKWTANNGENSSSEITITNNLFYDHEVGISIGGNETAPAYRFKNIDIQDNIFDSAGLSQQTQRTLGWNIDINDWDNGLCKGNYIINQNSDAIDNTFGIRVEGENRKLTIDGNILYGLKNARLLWVQSTDIKNSSIRNNELFVTDNNSKHIFLDNNVPSGLTFEGNKYIDKNNDPSFYINRKQKTRTEWNASTFEGVGSTIEIPDYKDPTRSLKRYVIEELGLSAIDDFFLNLRKQNIFNWEKAYRTKTINAWIKEGFETPSNLGISEINSEVETSQLLESNYGDGRFKIKDKALGIALNLIIVDSKGVVVYNKPLNNTIGTISGLPKGVYYFIFVDDKKKIRITEKYLKN